MTELSKMLEEYRAGERGLPTYDELAALLDKPSRVRVFQSAEQNEQLARDAQAILDAAPAQGDALADAYQRREAYYAHSGNSTIDFDGREWGDFIGGWDAAIAAKAAS